MSEWKNWHGDEKSPVPPDTMVEIRLRDGSTNMLPASILDWVHDRDFCESDIVQFREVEDYKACNLKFA